MNKVFSLLLAILFCNSLLIGMDDRYSGIDPRFSPENAIPQNFTPLYDQKNYHMNMHITYYIKMNQLRAIWCILNAGVMFMKK